MARDYVKIETYDGITTAVSKEDRKVELLQTLVNLRHGKIRGRAVKRGGYSSILSSGLTTLKRMIEFKNKNASTLLMVMDGNTLKESVYSAGYGAIGAIANDERTGSASIDGDNFNPIIVNKEMRSGAGISAATQLPLWYGYIATRNIFNGGSSVTAGKYLDDQDYSTKFAANIDIALGVHAAGKTSAGLDAGYYTVYASPVLDGYQRGIPTNDITFVSGATTQNYIQVATGETLEIRVYIDTSVSYYTQRLTGIDLFVAYANSSINDLINAPAYFLERIDINNDGNYFFGISGDVGTTNANKITIADYANWESFNTANLFVADKTNSNDYRVTSRAYLGVDAVLTVTPNASADGTADLQFFSRWVDQGGTGVYEYNTVYDNDAKKLGSEMYAYLNIPVGDEGIPDFRYKYSAYNGNRALYSGFPTDTNFSYYSANEAPDVVPSQNIFRHKFDTRGVVSVGRDFFVFTDRGIERISIYGNAQTEQDDDFSNSILAHTKSIVKVSDTLIAFMSYNGPRIIAGREEFPIGEALSQWWNETFTQAQKEACVAGYNFLHEELYFSFPTYTTAPYTNGIVFVFDMKAWRNEYISPWWIFDCDTPIYSFEGPNTLQHLLAGGLTTILDIDGGASESFATSYKMKLMQNPVPGKKVWWDRVYVDVETTDTVTANLYFDGSSTPVALTLNSDLNGFIRYMKETFELELTTPASAKTVEHKGMLLSFTPRSK